MGAVSMCFPIVLLSAEKIWDHCAGFCIVEEAGGKVGRVLMGTSFLPTSDNMVITCHTCGFARWQHHGRTDMAYTHAYKAACLPAL